MIRLASFLTLAALAFPAALAHAADAVPAENPTDPGATSRTFQPGGACGSGA